MISLFLVSACAREALNQKDDRPFKGSMVEKHVGSCMNGNIRVSGPKRWTRNQRQSGPEAPDKLEMLWFSPSSVVTFRDGGGPFLLAV